MLEFLVTHPALNVAESEYRRLLGYPRDYAPGERAEELSAQARDWYSRNGEPWIYASEVPLRRGDGRIELGDAEFRSPALLRHLERNGAQRAMVIAVSAGSRTEAHARELWDDSKPDEFFFLARFGAAVVEHLVATCSGRICAAVEADGWSAVPHYSPGYGKWDVADQPALHGLIGRCRGSPFPDRLDVLPSGMLDPKNSQLLVVGLAARTAAGPGPAPSVPCGACSFHPCAYRRRPYRRAPRAETELPSHAEVV